MACNIKKKLDANNCNLPIMTSALHHD